MYLWEFEAHSILSYFQDYSHRKSRVSLRAGASTSSNSTAASPTAPSPDTQQVGHTTHQRQLSDSGDEAIDILQIPTIRPPEGFTTDCPVDPEHNVSQVQSFVIAFTLSECFVIPTAKYYYTDRTVYTQTLRYFFCFA